MRHYLPLIAAGLFGALFAGAAVYEVMTVEVARSETGQSVPVPTRTALFEVKALTCGSCERSVRRALSGKPGVTGVAVNIDAGTVAVRYEEGKADPNALADAITRAGYPARYLSSRPSNPESSTGGTGGTQQQPRKSGGCGGSCFGEKS